MYLKPLLRRARVTWLSRAVPAEPLASVPGHGGQQRSRGGWLPANRASSWDPASRAPCRSRLARCCCASVELGKPPGIWSSPRASPGVSQQACAVSLPTCRAQHQPLIWCQLLCSSSHPKLPPKCNPDELLGMGNVCSGCPDYLKPRSAGEFKESAESF